MLGKKKEVTSVWERDPNHEKEINTGECSVFGKGLKV
jgi:hypothetical protein